MNYTKKTFYSLIADIIDSSPNKRLSVSDIYAHVANNMAKHKLTNDTWKNSVRHALSFKKVFVRLKPEENSSARRGCLWTIDESFRNELNSPRKKRNYRPKDVLTRLAQIRNKQREDLYSIIDVYLNKYLFNQKKSGHTKPGCITRHLVNWFNLSKI